MNVRINTGICVHDDRIFRTLCTYRVLNVASHSSFPSADVRVQGFGAQVDMMSAKTNSEKCYNSFSCPQGEDGGSAATVRPGAEGRDTGHIITHAHAYV
jgi:hypothetical protein